MQIVSFVEKTRNPHHTALPHMPPYNQSGRAFLFCIVQLLSSALFGWLLASKTLPPVGKGDWTALGSRSLASECAMGKVRWCDDAVLPGAVMETEDGAKCCACCN